MRRAGTDEDTKELRPEATYRLGGPAGAGWTLGLAIVFGLTMADARADETSAASNASSSAPSPVEMGSEAPQHETNCSDRIDEDRDTVTDCADSDCYDVAPCNQQDQSENSRAACSDFIDNDGDHSIDCEDADCWVFSDLCNGSYRTPIDENALAFSEGIESLEELLGRGDDVDGERDDEACSDGYDNDQDGKTDCDDVGCRFDPQVSVCRSAPSLRFALWADIAHSYEVESEQWLTSFNALQLRTFGPLPLVQDGFFLLSARLDKTPRLSFAFFTVPIYHGHKLTISSGGARLSSGPILSLRKNVFLGSPRYLYSAFEQGNGAAVEFSGPVIPGLMDYRVVGAGGSGEYSGNVGGRYFRSDERNYTWAGGAQAIFYLMGHYDDDTSRYLYTSVAPSLSLLVGGKYEQRAGERFPAANLLTLFRWNRITASLEAYGKRELEFKTWQASYNAMVGVLIVPRWIFLAADFGEFRATNFKNLPAVIDSALGSELKRIRGEREWRVALHLYVWRTNGIVSLLYVDNVLMGQDEDEEASIVTVGLVDERTRTASLHFQFSF